MRLFLPLLLSARLIVLQKFTNTDFLQPLIQRMIAPHQEQRPTAQEALDLWVEIREMIPLIKRVWRPHPSGEDVREAAVQDAISLFNASMCSGFETLLWW